MGNIENQGQLEIRRNLAEATREELLEIIVARDGRDTTGKYDWWEHYYAADHELRRLRAILRSEYHTDKSLRHAQHVADLESLNKKLRSEVREMQVAAERHNAEAFASGLIVHCTGCEAGAPFDSDSLTEDRVIQVEQIATRLRRWWTNHKDRVANKAE